MTGQIQIRQATAADIPAMAAVERESWPAALAASEADFRARLAAYPDGQLVAEVDGAVVGTIAAQRISPEFLAASPTNYDRITDSGRFTRSHQPAGGVFQLIGVGVAPGGRGLNLGRRLVDRQIERARALDGVSRIVGFTRPARFHRHPALDIDGYVALRNSAGRRLDPVLAFHLDSGARLVSVHPGFRPDDHESRGYGVLIEYPV